MRGTVEETMAVRWAHPVAARFVQRMWRKTATAAASRVELTQLANRVRACSYPINGLRTGKPRIRQGRANRKAGPAVQSITPPGGGTTVDAVAATPMSSGRAGRACAGVGARRSEEHTS